MGQALSYHIKYLSCIEKQKIIKLESQHHLADWDVYEYMYSNGEVNIYGYVGSTGWKDPIKYDNLSMKEKYSDFLWNKCPYCKRDIFAEVWEIVHCKCFPDSPESSDWHSDLIKVDVEEYCEEIRKSGLKPSNIMSIEDFETFARKPKYGRIDLHKCPACGTRWIPPEVVTNLGKQWFKCAYCKTKLVKHKGKLDIKKWVDNRKKRSKKHKQVNLFE